MLASNWSRPAILALCIVLWPTLAPAEGDPARAEAEARVKALLEEVSKLAGEGRLSDARARAQEAVEEAEHGVGAEDPLTADALSWLGGMQQATGDLQGAMASNERALAISEKVFGPDAPTTASMVKNLASLHYHLGDFQRSRALYERALAIREKALGPDDVRTGSCLNGLATVLQKLGDVASAKKLYERSLAIHEKSLGAEHLETVTVMSNLGSLLRESGDLRGARKLQERALAIREKVLGPRHPNTARSLNNLASTLLEAGDLKAARVHAERALDIWEQVLGRDHPDTAIALINLASVFQGLGDLNRARPLIERAVGITEKRLGPVHPATASSLQHLALLLEELGDLDSAKALFERSLTILEKSVGAEHPLTALCLQSLAIVSVRQEDGGRARTLLERAVAINERKLGADNPCTASSLDVLGTVLSDLGELDRARSLHARALAVRERVLGAAHPDTLRSLNNLAVVLRMQDRNEEARELLDRSLRACEESLGHDHPLTLATTTNLAHALKKLGRKDEARAKFARAWAVYQEELRVVLPLLSSRERCAKLKRGRMQLAYHLAEFADDPETTWAAALSWKGAALRAGAATLRLPADATEDERRIAGELEDARRDLARVAFQPAMSAGGPKPSADLYQTLRKRVERLERDLAASRSEAIAGASLDASPQGVRDALPKGAVLVDIVENLGVVHAWVVRREGKAAYVRVGDAGEIGTLAGRFRESLERDDEAGWKEEGGKVRDRLESVLAPALEGAVVLYVSPDGVLATFPWALLPEREGFLVERMPVICVNGGASLATGAASRASEGRGIVALGAIDYSGLDRRWGPLPETEGEAERVIGRFRAAFPDAPCEVVRGSGADEGAFRRLVPSVGFVHVATHGFFDMASLRVASSVATRGLSGKESALLSASQEVGQDVRSWNPLLLSGLVLARSEDGDGYLTAEELQDLDLRGVQLVVLSACDTGRGELAAGEGVLGLSRALAIAGARQFMLSLWKVPDAETAELMDTFYEGLWEKGLLAEEALRRAQLAMLARDREKGVFRPSTWGAWVLTR